MKSDEYSNWSQSDQSSLLLLYGKPACGKSVLSRFIFDTMTESCNSDTHRIVAPFFFLNVGHDPANNGSANDQREMLQAILYEILYQAPELFPYFQAAFKKLKDAASAEPGCRITWTQNALEEVLANVTSHSSHQKTIYVLVDGLDESCGSESCADCLVKFLPGKDSTISIKLLVATQRNEPATKTLKRCFEELKERLPDQSEVIYSMTLEDKNLADILEYTGSFLNERCIKDIEWKQTDVDDCREILIQKANGIFLWLKLAERHVDDYCQGRQEASIGDFKDFLNDIPDDIGRLYKKLFDRMMEKIKGQKNQAKRIQRVRNMLRVAMNAKGPPLLLEEFRDAYLVPPAEEWATFSIFEARPAKVRHNIHEFTANFLEVRWNGTDYTVQLLHQTAATFLQDESIENKPLREDGCGADLSTMASACFFFLKLASYDLTYHMDLHLDRQGLSAGHLRNQFKRFAEALDRYPLLPYAIKHTASHVHMQNDSQRGKLLALLVEMKDSNIRLLLRGWINRLAKRIGSAELVPSFEHVEEDKFADDLLHVATTEHLFTAVKVALEAGANPRSRSTLYDSGEDVLSLLAMSSPSSISTAQEGTEVTATAADVAICRLLISAGAEVDAPTHYQGTALHYAAKYMNHGVLEELIRHHAQVNYPDSQDMTPLHRAVIGLSQKSTELTELDARGRPPRVVSEQCVKTLIRHGADLHAGDNQGQMPIHWAAGLKNRTPILCLLIQGHSGQDWGKPKLPPKKNAAKRASNEKCLYKHATPLHWASGHGYEENVKVLIQYGANIEWADDYGRTALHWAARYGHKAALVELLKALKDAKKDLKSAVNKKEQDGRTPLIWACQWGHVECAKLLINAGADVDLGQGDQDDNDIGGTPLSWAVTWGHSNVIKLLIDKGADIEPPCDGRRPLLCWAALNGNADIFDYILELAESKHLKLDVDNKDGRLKTPFMIAAAHGHLDFVRHLYSLHRRRVMGIKINFNARDQKGNTALHLAASWNHKDVVKWLIETPKLGINETNYARQTALHRAARSGAEEVLSYLLQKGAREDIHDKDGKEYSWYKNVGREFGNEEE